MLSQSVLRNWKAGGFEAKTRGDVNKCLLVWAVEYLWSIKFRLDIGCGRPNTGIQQSGALAHVCVLAGCGAMLSAFMTEEWPEGDTWRITKRAETSWLERLKGRDATIRSRAVDWLDAWNQRRWLVGCRDNVAVDYSLSVRLSNPDHSWLSHHCSFCWLCF